MIKRIVGADSEKVSDADEHSIDLEGLSEVEVTSETAARPIEFALLLPPQSGSGWEAAEPGPQTVRILFDQPRRFKEVSIEFQEFSSARTQEFVLRWSSDGGKSYREIVRQQYNFSPPSTTAERERYLVNLEDVTHLELTIIPDISGGPARASLSRLRIGSTGIWSGEVSG